MSEIQGRLFDTSPDMRPIAPVDPNVRKDDVRRLSRQCQDILEILRKGPATNKDLAAVGFRYGARIHDLKAAGYTIAITHGVGGLNTYTLTGEP